MYKYLNLHPYELLVDDCVKRSIAMAANMEYSTVQRELNRHKKVTGVNVFYEGDNAESYVKNILHGEKIVFPKRKNMTGSLFCEEYPKGNYILDMDTHWTACVDGVIYDTWDCSEEKVEYAYKIIPRVQKKKLTEPKTYCVTFEIKESTYRRYSQYTVTICDENGRMKEKPVSGDTIIGYKHCLNDFGYKEIKE